jgi:RND family efflux transporter MFP subunit
MFLTACEGPSSPAASIREPAPEPVVEVQTARLRRGVLAQALSAPGSVVARRRSLIGAEVTGRILRVHVSVGDRVAVGAPLFEIDPTTYAMALRQAEAGLDVAAAERRQMESDLKRASTLRRQNVLAQQELERLTTALAVAQARVRQATESVALAQQILQKTQVQAPYAGSIVERLADEGTTALVQPQTVVVVLEETADLEAHASIAESQMALVSVGDPATVRIEGLAEPVDTSVAAVADSIDPATRTYLVKMPVPNPEFRVKAGVFAHVEIHPRKTPEKLLAPREAIRVEDGRSRLLVVRDGHVETRTIEVGVVSDNEAEILSGADGSEVVVIGAAARTVVGGMRVQLAATVNQQP